MDEHLNRIGRSIVRASASNFAEAEAASQSPFLYAKVRARIGGAKEGRVTGERWQALPSVVWRALPGMAIATVLAFGSLGAALLQTSPSQSVGVEDFLTSNDTGFERAALPGKGPLSNDDVLSAIMSGGDVPK